MKYWYMCWRNFLEKPRLGSYYSDMKSKETYRLKVLDAIGSGALFEQEFPKVDTL